jgi:hypothetical protein
MAAPFKNKNAEQWTIEEATKLFDDAIDLSNEAEYDFIGEVARDLGTYRDIFGYLADKYNVLNIKHKTILSNLEANCFSHAKKGTIKEATAIVNLKSNYKWTDRADLTTNNEKLNVFPTLDQFYGKVEKSDE